MNKKTDLPKFKNEDAERDYWAKFDLSDHFSSKDFLSVSLPNLKPTSSAISVRVPNYLLVRLKERAHELNIPYQTLMKQYIANGIFAHH
jgi:predicted DNA binding CopG/RHH family protein